MYRIISFSLGETIRHNWKNICVSKSVLSSCTCKINNFNLEISKYTDLRAMLLLINEYLKKSNLRHSFLLLTTYIFTNVSIYFKYDFFKKTFFNINYEIRVPVYFRLFPYQLIGRFQNLDNNFLHNTDK